MNIKTLFVFLEKKSSWHHALVHILFSFSFFYISLLYFIFILVKYIYQKNTCLFYLYFDLIHLFLHLLNIKKANCFNVFPTDSAHLSTEPFKGHCGGKKSEWVEKIQGGRKKYFSNVLRSLAKLLRSLEKLCVPSQNFCVLSQRYLRSLAKLLLSLVNIFFFLSFARERKYLCERTQKFCERTQSFSRERKSFARERKVSRGNAKVLRENAKHLKNIFSSHPEFFSTHPEFFPPQCPLKGSVPFP